jgi:hypothetical protein
MRAEWFFMYGLAVLRFLVGGGVQLVLIVVKVDGGWLMGFNIRVGVPLVLLWVVMMVMVSDMLVPSGVSTVMVYSLGCSG